MENSQEDIKIINNKLVELASKLIRIQYRLDAITPVGKNHVEPINSNNTAESIKQRRIQISKWTDK